MIAERHDLFLEGMGCWWTAMAGTAKAYLKRTSAYTIELIRWPLGPLIMFGTYRVTYGLTGRTKVDGVDVAGFLVVGMFALITWTTAIWASGYALEFERNDGTSAALFLSPASRSAVVIGYGIGAFIWFIPSFAVLGVLGLVTGAQLHIADPFALTLAVAALIIAALTSGFLLSGLFILSRRGNLIANFMQMPIYMLSGCLVPRSLLPPWLHPISDGISASHAIDALRASALHGASLGSTAGAILVSLSISGVYVVLGSISLRKVENVAKRAGQLDLH